MLTSRVYILFIIIPETNYSTTHLSADRRLLKMTPATRKPTVDDPDSLRTNAEKTLALHPAGSSVADGRTPDQVNHELRVHQIELEMQNEALRDAHLALEESRDKYVDLYEFAPVGYLTLSENAVIEEGNLTIATLLGVERAKLIRDRFRRFIPDKDRETWDQHFVTILRSTEKQACELRLLKNSGVLFNARLESIRMDREGRDPVVRIAISDITSYKDAEKAIGRLNDERKLLIENIPAMIWYKDTQNNYVRVNPAGARTYGRPAGDIEGKNAGEIFPDDAKKYFLDDLEVISSGKPKYGIIERMKTASGENLWIRADKIPLKDETGTVTGVLVFCVDITRAKLAEEEMIRNNKQIGEVNTELTAQGNEMRLNELRLTAAGDMLRENEANLKVSLAEKEVLLAEIHHRVKNNLTAFISLLALDGSYEETPAGQKLRTDLQNRARSMALIHETLYKTRTFSNVDMGIYLATLTEQVAGTYQTGKSIRTVVNADGITLDLARATPCGLITNELITNTFKYAFPKMFDCESIRKEPCTLWVSLTASGGFYTLSVRDNGMGLPESFDVKTAKSLGLKLVNFLSRHQLRAKVGVSRENGTEFTIRFKE
jgi:PAS domain S-box-containing protein